MPSPARSVAWQFVLCDATGNALCEIDTASGKSITYHRNNFPEAQMTLSYKDQAAQSLIDCLYGASYITAQIPTLKAYRKGPNDSSAQLRFYGSLAPFQDQADTEQALLTPIFRGPFSRLMGDGNNRGFFTGVDDWYTNLDAGAIAHYLVNTGNSQSPFTIATHFGPWEQPTVTRIKEYQSANCGQEIINLSALLDGFDFEMVPVDYVDQTWGHVMAEFHVYADQGTVQNAAKFEYGAATLANCKGLRRTISPPINSVTVLGGNGMTSTQIDAASISQYGIWRVQVAASDIIDQPTLDAKAHGMLRHFPVKTLEIQPDTALSPRPWDDYWIGDSVPVYANHGALRENTLLRVNTIQVVIDDNGYEAAEVQDPVSGEKGVHRTMIKSKLAGEVTDDSG